MKNYFDNHYPRRLKDLKEELDKISISIFGKELNNNDNEIKQKITEFVKVINKFADNTNLHITNLSSADPKYLNMIMPKYLLDYFGEETPTGKMFKILYKSKF